MRSEQRRQGQLLDRCWSLYLALTEVFALPETFHSDFPAAAEAAVLTGALHIVIPLGEQLTLSVREEYTVTEQSVEVRRYSYNVIDPHGVNLLRADNLPHHRTDYRRRPLSHPPHHIHDQRGRVLSFSGQIQDFLRAAQGLLPSPTR